MTTIVLILLVAAAIVSVARVVRRGTLVDRVLGVDLLLYVLAALLAVHTVRSERPSFSDIPLVVSLLGVLGTVAASIWLARRGDEESS